MAATPSIKITKSFTYRGNVQLWSNRHHCTGGTPADQSHFDTLADAVVAAEALCAFPEVTIVKAEWYPAGSDVATFFKVYSTAGSHSLGTSVYMPGDCVALIRWATAARSSKNHPIYLYSYIHGCIRAAGDPPDTLDPNMATLLNTYAGDWVSGFSDGTNTYVRSGPNGADAVSHTVSSVIRHRDFPT